MRRKEPVRSAPARVRHRRTWLGATLATATLATAALVGCAACSVTGQASAAGRSRASDAASAQASHLIVDAESNPTGPVSNNYNPYTQGSALTALGATDMIYEPLLQFDGADLKVVRPWLATSAAWSDGGRTLTYTIRTGVKWSDGTPFTSADVAFSFGLLEKDPALQALGGQSPFASFTAVRAPNATTVVLTFAHSAKYLFYQLSTFPMVPRHLWEGVDPLTYTNPHPVGTGPFLLRSGNAQGLLLVRNPHYWQHGLPRIGGIRYPVYDSNTGANLALEQGQLQWTSNFVPSIKSSFVGRDPSHHRYWFPSIGENFLCPNLTKPIFQSVAVRKAISMALDRKMLSTSATFGELPPPTSPTGLPLPLYKSFLDPAYRSLRYHSGDAAGAKALLRKARYHWSSSGQLLAPGGAPVQFGLVAPSGWTDVMSEYQIVSQELSGLGMKVSVQGVSLTAYEIALSQGKYDMAVCSSLGAPITNPFYMYESLLDGVRYEPVGTFAYGDFERWKDPTTDKLIGQWLSATTDAQRQQALDGVEKVMVTEVPVIPLIQTVAYAEYDTAAVTGFPSAAHPYALGSPAGAEAEVVALRLRPRG